MVIIKLFNDYSSPQNFQYLHSRHKARVLFVNKVDHVVNLKRVNRLRYIPQHQLEVADVNLLVRYFNRALVPLKNSLNPHGLCLQE